MDLSLTRRAFAQAIESLFLAAPALAQNEPPLIQRAIPKTGESLPGVGLGTAYVFDEDNDETRQKAAAVVQALIARGGRLIDTASTYGEAEVVLGNVIAAANVRSKLFIATKLEAPDAAELKRSLTRLKTAKVDLLQLHNVHEPHQSLAQFKAWKAQGLCRYIGITSTFHRDFAAVESALHREQPDFVQIDYSLDDREVEKRILPAAANVNAAVLTAVPLGRGRLFRAVRGRPIPDWAQGFAASWAQFFLKFILADRRVTAVIPGTGNPAHMTDNLEAMHGRLPDAEERKRMIGFAEGL